MNRRRFLSALAQVGVVTGAAAMLPAAGEAAQQPSVVGGMSGTLRPGDVFTFSGAYIVNPYIPEDYCRRMERRP